MALGFNQMKQVIHYSVISYLLTRPRARNATLNQLPNGADNCFNPFYGAKSVNINSAQQLDNITK